MINPDDQRKETTTAEIDSDERGASRPSSTAEVAKDLDRSEVGGRPSDAAATLFPEKKRATSARGGRIFKPVLLTSRADRSSRPMRWWQR